PGRAVTSAEFALGGPHGALLSPRFGSARFGGDAAVVGRRVEINSVLYTIAGALPPAADRFPAGGADLWIPLTFAPTSFLNQRGSVALSAVGRVRPGVGMSRAQQELATIAARLAAEYPDTNRNRGVILDRLQDAMVGPIRAMLLLLAGAIAARLAVASANIANLLLAHAQSRRLEFDIRTAIGASRGRLVRQLWTETAALFSFAGILGVALASPLASAIIDRYPDALPLAASVALDRRVVAAAAGITLLAALLAGLPRSGARRVADRGRDL